VSVRVKDMDIGRFLNNLLLTGIEGEIQRKATNVTSFAGMATFNKQRALYFAVHHNLFSRVCLRNLTFCANCIWYS
jgi:hypothetical protein